MSPHPRPLVAFRRRWRTLRLSRFGHRFVFSRHRGAWRRQPPPSSVAGLLTRTPAITRACHHAARDGQGRTLLNPPACPVCPHLTASPMRHSRSIPQAEQGCCMIAHELTAPQVHPTNASIEYDGCERCSHGYASVPSSMLTLRPCRAVSRAGVLHRIAPHMLEPHCWSPSLSIPIKIPSMKTRDT